MTKLGVNIDHIANLREARKTNEPDPVAAAVIAELAGCHGITVHLRSDRRHIQDRDVELLRETVKTRLNLEMAATEEMIRFAREVKPDTATLVPEFAGELTTQGGLDCVRNHDVVSAAAQELEAAGIAVSLFIDPEKEQIEAAQRMGVPFASVATTQTPIWVRTRGLAMHCAHSVAARCLFGMTKPRDSHLALRAMHGQRTSVYY